MHNFLFISLYNMHKYNMKHGDSTMYVIFLLIYLMELYMY